MHWLESWKFDDKNCSYDVLGSEQQSCWPDCAHAQVHLRFCFSHVSRSNFSPLGSYLSQLIFQNERKNSGEHIGLDCPCVRLSISPAQKSFKRGFLKFHIWIPLRMAHILVQITFFTWVISLWKIRLMNAIPVFCILWTLVASSDFLKNK